MKFIVAIDSLKGCLTSAEANKAAAEGISSRMPDAEVLEVAVSDGGEGWLEAFHNVMGGSITEVKVKDPLMRETMAKYLMKGDVAVIEMAQASGLALLREEERNPMVATSYGTGQLVADAVMKGAKHVIVGLGGSGTSDCGKGMLRALIDEFSTDGTWNGVRAMDDVHVTIAADVNNPLCGERGAAKVFGPQKGATPDMVEVLDAMAKEFAEVSAKRMGYDRQDQPGAGAAGGLGYAFMQYMNAEYRSGAELLLEAAGFDQMLCDVSMVVTGEGRADRQTLMGKLPQIILQHCKRAGVPVMLIAGKVDDKQLLLEAGFHRVECINPPTLSMNAAMNPETAKENIRKTLNG